jgi:CO/xanthine dehydrogenase Mo-binding subunit
MAYPQRVEGWDKVLGEPIFARDFLHFEGSKKHKPWARTKYQALLIQAEHADRKCVFDREEVDRAVEEKAVLERPRVITASDLIDAGIEPLERNEVPIFGHNWLVPDDSVAEHIGQPVAILLFKSPSDLRAFQRWVKEHHGRPVRYDRPPAEPNGNPIDDPVEDVRGLLDPLLFAVQKGHDPARDYGSTHCVRIAPDRGSFWTINPGMEAAEKRAIDLELFESVHTVERAIAENTAADGPGWRVIRRVFSTQVTDPMFLEPEAGLAWWDRRANVLRLLLGTQSPHGDCADILTVFNKAKLKGLSEAKIELIACYPGGAFGGRDVSSFPMYLALAAVFAKDGPVRLCYDRFEQFQVGIKRHASAVESVLGYSVDGPGDRKVTLEAFRSIIYLDGGSEMNLTRPVVTLAALHAAGPYRIPRTVISAFGVRTGGAPAGSKRGFGIPQVTFAIESMIDEIADLARVDPIELRLDNVLRQGDSDVAGFPLGYPLANEAICKEALKHQLWTERNERKQNREESLNAPGTERLLSYGVGFACCMEAFGTTRDGVCAAVELTDDGQIIVTTPAVDMGQGSATALALVAAQALDVRQQFVEGQQRIQVDIGATKAFESLRLREVGEAREDSQGETPRLINSSSASMTSFHHLHAVEQACGILRKFSIKPAAQRLRGQGLDSPSLEEVAHRAHVDRLPVGVMVHTYFQGEYARASFTIEGIPSPCKVDAVALRRPGGRYTRQPRAEVWYPREPMGKYPRSLYASVGHIVGVEVQHHTGRVRVIEAVTLLDAGEVHHEDLVRGQVEGGFAMGIGYALMEWLPPAPRGVDGSWNLDRYKVPKPRDMPFEDLKKGRMDVVFVDPLRDHPHSDVSRLPRRKGIAEATMTTVAPAISNAVAHATGLRFNSLPITEKRLRHQLLRLERHEARS